MVIIEMATREESTGRINNETACPYLITNSIIDICLASVLIYMHLHCFCTVMLWETSEGKCSLTDDKDQWCKGEKKGEGGSVN